MWAYRRTLNAEIAGEPHHFCSDAILEAEPRDLFFAAQSGKKRVGKCPALHGSQAEAKRDASLTISAFRHTPTRRYADTPTPPCGGCGSAALESVVYSNLRFPDSRSRSGDGFTAAVFCLNRPLAALWSPGCSSTTRPAFERHRGLGWRSGDPHSAL